jgi:hypothetical protein
MLIIPYKKKTMEPIKQTTMERMSLVSLSHVPGGLLGLFSLSFDER